MSVHLSVTCRTGNHMINHRGFILILNHTIHIYKHTAESIFTKLLHPRLLNRSHTAYLTTYLSRHNKPIATTWHTVIKFETLSYAVLQLFFFLSGWSN